MQVNVYEAKTRLSALLDKASAGATIIIARARSLQPRRIATQALGNGPRAVDLD
jgi:hypothetical protein